MPDRLEADLTERLLRVDVATIGHRDHITAADRRIQSLLSGAKIVGPAVTLRLEERDSALLHHAIGLCRPGDVLVIDRAGDDTHACLGGGVAFAAKTAGIAGAVIDGPATDPAELREIGFPVWARGVSPVTTRILGETGHLNQPISFGDTRIAPGDVVLADDSGVIFVVPDQAESIASWAIERQDFLTARRAKLTAGAVYGELSGASAKLLATLEKQESVDV